MAVVGRIESVRETKNRGEANDGFLLVRVKIAKIRVASSGQCSTMKARDEGGESHVPFIQSQWRAVLVDQVARFLVMSLVVLRFADIVKEGGGVKAGAWAESVVF